MSRAGWRLAGASVGVLVAVVAGRGSLQATDTEGPYELRDGGMTYGCGPIHYLISEAQLPDDFRTVVDGAIGKVSAATGFRFYFDGMTPDRNFDAHRIPGSSGPVLIGFANSSEAGQFAGDVIGLGGSVVGPDGAHYGTGSIMLDSVKYADTPDLAERQAIVMHELGHVLGLAHVHDDGELMNEDNVGRTEFGPGDLEGLRVLRANSCDEQGTIGPS
ncbi:MAG: hypothetical protein QM572_14740 [Nocardioides sp.]|uniref:hypothetical protein n=1 Tax=Nocardioides sp. TaxID=35761 RepID=UPI0039E2DF49